MIISSNEQQLFDKNQILIARENIQVPSPNGKGRGTTFHLAEQVIVCNDRTEQFRGKIVKIRKKNSSTAYPLTYIQIKKYFAWVS